MRRRSDIIYNGGDFEITKRELIASIVLIALMLILGIFISGKITNKIISDNMKYEQAIQINDERTFQHCVDTSIGDAFIQGVISATNPVTYDGLECNYMYIEQVEEHYTMHTRTVTHSNGKGGTYTTIETYYTWDTVDIDEKSTDTVSFLGKTFQFSDFEPYLQDRHIDTIDIDSYNRYVYYGVAESVNATLFATLENNSMKVDRIFEDMSIKEAVDAAIQSPHLCILFWIIWIILTGLVVFGFYIIDNRWLED
jgi:hypothetical protein